MKVGSLFSGIGGLDLGLERAGMQVVWQSEIDPYACRVLKKHWPNVPNHGDITQIDWQAVEPVDLICGGFPCQDISLAGKGAGINEGTRSGLWFQFRESIRVLRPRYVIIENVAALLVRGGDIVIGDLAALGYDAEWQIVSAAEVGAAHRRERVFIVAYTNSQRQRQPQDEADPGGVGGQARVVDCGDDFVAPGRDASELAYTEHNGRDKCSQDEIREVGGGRGLLESAGKGLPQPRPAGESTDETETGTGVEPECQRSGGIFQPVTRADFWNTGEVQTGADSTARIVEPGICLLAHGIPERVARLKALGNAVVPQVAEYVGRCIMEAS